MSTIASRGATSASRTSGTRASTPSRSSTTRTCPPEPKTLMMLYKRLREIDVPEMMASIIAETKGKPWGYYRDMSRQLWDEARHAMMGEVGFVALGVDWTKARITAQLVASAQHRMHADRTPCGALLHRAGPDDEDRQTLRMGGRRRVGHSADRHDPGLRLGRRGAARPARPGVVHPRRSATGKQALAYGDKCWSRILSNWQAVQGPGPDRARELVAGHLRPGVRRRGAKRRIRQCWRLRRRMKERGRI